MTEEIVVTAENMLQMRFEISRSLAKILVLLAENDLVTAKMIETDHSITKDAKVAIHRLRRRMEKTGFDIRSQRGFGYWLEPQWREWLLDQMKSPRTELAHGDGANSGAAAAT